VAEQFAWLPPAPAPITLIGLHSVETGPLPSGGGKGLSAARAGDAVATTDTATATTRSTNRTHFIVSVSWLERMCRGHGTQQEAQGSVFEPVRTRTWRHCPPIERLLVIIAVVSFWAGRWWAETGRG
jgi:hypothetical protein